MTSREKNLFLFFHGEKLEQNNMNLALNAQLIADAERGWQFHFTSPNGKTISINKANNMQENGSVLSRSAILAEIKRQVDQNNFNEEDIKALCDFVAHCPSQGLCLGKLTTNNIHINQIHIEGDSRPTLTVNYSQNGNVTIKVNTQGKTGGATCNLATPKGIAVINPETEAEVVFTYPKSIGEAKGVVDSISVKKFEQKIGDVTFF